MTSAPERGRLGSALAFAAIGVLSGCGEEAITRFGGVTMGTSYQVTYSPTAGSVQDEMRAVEDLLEEINESLSTYIDTSVISRVNQSADTASWHPIDRHFETVFARARAIYEDTGGAFNPAVGPLVDAWGFGPEGPQALPGPDAVDRLLQLVSFDLFEIRSTPPGVRKQMAESRLDFSAIAKGYGVDAVGRLIEGWGVRNYFVEIGGEVRTRGEHPERRRWRIGIERPSDDPSRAPEIQSVLALGDAALATSGDYRNYRLGTAGRKIAHILDPRTGYPVTSPLASVSVLARDAMTADAYATAFMVMGIEDALDFVEAREELEAYFIASDPAGNIIETRSSGFPPAVEEQAARGFPVLASVDLPLVRLAAGQAFADLVSKIGVVRSAGAAELAIADEQNAQGEQQDDRPQYSDTDQNSGHGSQ